MGCCSGGCSTGGGCGGGCDTETKLVDKAMSCPYRLLIVTRD